MGEKHRKCGYSAKLCKESCYLQDEVIFQANSGGKTTAEGVIQNTFSEPGPYWSRDGFEGYTSRVLDLATEKDCLRREELRKTIKEIIAQKDKDGQLIGKI